MNPFLHVSPDHLVASGMLPARRDPDGPFAWWQQMRPRLSDGFHRCLSALAAAGNDLIVEHIIEFRAWREDLATLPVGLDVFLVGVHCDLAEIDRREMRPERSPYRRGPVARGNRPDPHVRTLRLRGRHGERGPRRGCCICTDRLASRTRARVLRRGIAGNRGTLSRTCRCRHSSRQMSASWKCARMIAGGYVLVVAVSLSPSATVTFTGPAGAVARLNFRP